MKHTIKIFVDKKLESTLNMIRSGELSSIVDTLGDRSIILEREPEFGRFYKWWNGIRRSISQVCISKRDKFEETNRMAHFVASV